MTSAWLLPEHLADVLPRAARRLESLRRGLLDLAQTQGYEPVVPPLAEHLDALLCGPGSDLGLRTFNIVDQLSGRTLGVRADTTPQVARIDAHLLNRQGPTRLCYCGPVLHARPSSVTASRELLQFGAELYGYAGLAADEEVIALALDAAAMAGLHSGLTLDLGDARIVDSLLGTHAVSAQVQQALLQALANKDVTALMQAAAGFPAATQDALSTLLSLYGEPLEVLARGRALLPPLPGIVAACDDLTELTQRLRQSHPQVSLSIDLSDAPGQAYYSGVRYALYAEGRCDALLRGGRYDEVGAHFGRARAAVGFSLDVKALAEQVPLPEVPTAILAPTQDDPELRAAVRRLRQQGQTVLCTLPDQPLDADVDVGHVLDRELVCIDGRWAVRARG